MLARPNPLISLAVAIALAAAILLALGRPPICTCGSVMLWGAQGPEQSQMLADWYSASHVGHGLLSYSALHLASPRRAGPSSGGSSSRCWSKLRGKWSRTRH